MNYRTGFISDIHVGAWGAKVRNATKFLTHNTFLEIHLLGDIFDFWAMNRELYWPQDNNTFVQKVLKISRNGTIIWYEPGNHDESIKHFDTYDFGNIKIRINQVHVTATGKRYLVIHGDQFDSITTRAQWVSKLGAWTYDKLLWINHWVALIQRRLDLPIWSISKFLKHKVKKAIQYMNDYEEALAQIARENDCSGVICGHIHNPEDRMIGDIHYLNTGDWVENQSAVVEHIDGRLELLINIQT